MILVAIIACEIAFWVAIIAGLAARYVLRRPGLGAALLIAAPLIDVVLLALVAIDLSQGATASWHHGLAAIYIGISIAYGKRMVAWADARFLHRFAGGPAPVKLYGAAYTAKCWADVARTGIAVGIAAGLLGAMILFVGDPVRTEELNGFFRILGIIFAIDLIWALSYTFWPRREPVRDAAPRPAVER